ncbi:unnamed protein product [Ceratitis capitata]|uniref:(Mediterranean fruit fly) hypothetical protein n=1 Tax=Ceratitis capitata TaxID=7213 RepID=A0A811UV33_CERCA|nr:unnamed protein product [Ceratitis capitata]
MFGIVDCVLKKCVECDLGTTVKQRTPSRFCVKFGSGSTIEQSRFECLSEAYAPPRPVPPNAGYLGHDNIVAQRQLINANNANTSTAQSCHDTPPSLTCVTNHTPAVTRLPLPPIFSVHAHASNFY